MFSLYSVYYYCWSGPPLYGHYEECPVGKVCIITVRVGLPYMGIMRNGQFVKCVLLMIE